MKEYDGLIIGHNEIEFQEYIERQEVNNGMSYELSYSFVYDDGVPTNLQDFYNRYADKNDIMKYGKLDSSSMFNTAVAYIGSYMSRKGISFDYINSFHADKEKLKEKLISNNYLTIAITTTFHFLAYPIQQVINFIRGYNTTAKIIVGGPYILDNMKIGQDSINKIIHRSLKADIYIVDTQGEDALVNVIKALKNNQTLDGINNVIYVKDKKLYINKFVPENNLLNDNMVNWSLFKDDIKYYAAIRTAISCPLSCAFCTYPSLTDKYNYASIESIKYELDKLQETGVVKSVYFVDDTFNVPIKRFKEILRMMIEQKYTFSWHSYIRCQFLDDEALELMVKSKCQGIMLGIESANNSMLKNMNKKATVEQYYKAMDLIKKYNITTMIYLLIGFPGETEETFEETLKFVKTTKPDFYRPFVWYASSKTPIMKRAEEFGIEGSGYNWKHNTMNSEQANKLYNRLFYEVKDSIWIPQYNSDFTGIAHFLARGLDLSRVKQLIQVYNSEIKRQKGLENCRTLSEDFVHKIKAILTK